MGHAVTAHHFVHSLDTPSHMVSFTNRDNLRAWIRNYSHVIAGYCWIVTCHIKWGCDYLSKPWYYLIYFSKRAPWTSYQIRKIAGCACARNAGNVFPRRRFQSKPLVTDPGMHHGTCVTHVPWCMSGSLTCGDGENVPGIPGACAPAILRIWQEAHGSASQAQVPVLCSHYWFLLVV